MPRDHNGALRSVWWSFVIAYFVIMFFTLAFQGVGVAMMLPVFAIALLITNRKLGTAWRMRPTVTTLFILYLAAVAALFLYSVAFSSQVPTPVAHILVIATYLVPLTVALLVLLDLHRGPRAP